MGIWPDRENLYPSQLGKESLTLFQKRDSAKRPPERNNMQSAAAACHSSNAEVAQRCAFVSALEDNAAGLYKKQQNSRCDGLSASTKEKIENQDLWPCAIWGRCQMEGFHLDKLFISLLPHILPDCVVRPVDSLYLKTHTAIRFHLAAWLQVWAAEIHFYRAERIQHPPETRRLRDLAYGALFWAKLKRWLRKSRCVCTSPKLLSIVSKSVRLHALIWDRQRRITQSESDTWI